MSNDAKTVVLIADDEPSTLALLGRHLRSSGYSVLEAADGDEAWELAHEHLPDLVILDVMMPGMSGWEVCRKVREAVSLAHTGVIMLTGIGETLNEMTSPLYGADAHVDKPFEFSALDARIREVLERRRAGALGRPDHADEEVRVTLPREAARPIAKAAPAPKPKAKPAPKAEKAPAKVKTPARPNAKAAKKAPPPAPKPVKKAAPAPTLTKKATAKAPRRSVKVASKPVKAKEKLTKKSPPTAKVKPAKNSPPTAKVKPAKKSPPTAKVKPAKKSPPTAKVKPAKKRR
jgi:CheY-like chemotaxis protein